MLLSVCTATIVLCDAAVVFVGVGGAVVFVAVVLDCGAIVTDNDELTLLTASDTSNVELKLDNDSLSNVGVAKESLD